MRDGVTLYIHQSFFFFSVITWTNVDSVLWHLMASVANPIKWDVDSSLTSKWTWDDGWVWLHLSYHIFLPSTHSHKVYRTTSQLAYLQFIIYLWLLRAALCGYKYLWSLFWLQPREVVARPRHVPLKEGNQNHMQQWPLNVSMASPGQPLVRLTAKNGCFQRSVLASGPPIHLCW